VNFKPGTLVLSQATAVVQLGATNHAHTYLIRNIRNFLGPITPTIGSRMYSADHALQYRTARCFPCWGYDIDYVVQRWQTPQVA